MKQLILNSALLLVTMVAFLTIPTLMNLHQITITTDSMNEDTDEGSSMIWEDSSYLDTFVATGTNIGVAGDSSNKNSNGIIDEQQQQQPPHDKFAYAYLVAGCHPGHPTSYRGYLYNIAVSKYLLAQYHSNADVVVMIRMHIDSDHTILPPEDEAILTKLGVIVQYLPKPLADNFHTAMMDKFRILNMTNYTRVLYLDGDVMPINNLDYMFAKSVGSNATLEENVVLAYNNEPAQGGFFMLRPDAHDFETISNIILQREQGGFTFDQDMGYGHKIVPPDEWESFKKTGTKWDFYGAYTDQGLLYHWVKYVKKKVTIIRSNYVKTYNQDESGNVQLIRQQSGDDVFSDVVRYGKMTFYMHNGVHNVFPYKDYKHFVEATKPWLKRTAKNPPQDVPTLDDAKFPNQLWFHVLRKLRKEYGFDVDPNNLNMDRAKLGHQPHPNMVDGAKIARQNMTDH